MSHQNINYQSLADENPFQDETTQGQQHKQTDAIKLNSQSDDAVHILNELDDTTHNSGILIHIVPETSKTRWNHIEDLDSFFTHMYNYQQRHGFLVIALDEIFQVLEFGFVIWLLIFASHCIKYDVLFGDTILPNNQIKTTLSDVIIPTAECVSTFSATTFIILFLATIYLSIRLFKTIYHITQYAEIKKFYNTALHIDDNDLDNITWHEVQQRVRKVQAEQHMCIDKEELTELDIYHRILRFKNYFVALINKELLPVRFRLPIIGEVVSLSRGLLFNIDFILFRGPGSPFQNKWQLRDEFASRGCQTELAKRLSKLILCIALINLLLSPLIFLWQLIYFSFSYVNILRKEPSALGLRTWSNYGRLYLRHFNELDHELDARLNRAYEYADRYLSSFSSPLMTVIARYVLFITGGPLLLILIYGIYEEHVFQVEHVLTLITILTVIGLVCRTLIPDENMIWCPEQLMTGILAHVHYLPTEWKEQAHTANVRAQFSNMFQFKAGYLLNEIFSPFITPFLLMFVLRPKSLEIIKFFRSFTVSVRGVGNVCSFAQMNVRKHGNPDWQMNTSAARATAAVAAGQRSNGLADGKIEMSLVHFTLNNPNWDMPKEASAFMKDLRENAITDLVKVKTVEAAATTGNALTNSLISFGVIDGEYCSIANSVIASPLTPEQMQQSQEFVLRNDGALAESNYRQILMDNFSTSFMQSSSSPMTASVRRAQNMRKLKTSKVEGCPQGPGEKSLIQSLYGQEARLAKNPIDTTVADMCLSMLYLHEFSQSIRHARNEDRAGQRHDNNGGYDEEPGPSNRRYQNVNTDSVQTSTGSSIINTIVTTTPDAERTPLLGNVRS